MSQGRSGSSLLCNLIANIVGVGRTVLASELFGSGAGQKNAPKPGWAGFKWKPYYFDSEYGHALQWIGDKGVRIVYNFRNPLDVLMSKDKHDEVHLKGYCTKGDSRCIHKAVDLHTGPRLLQDLDALVHLMDVDMARAAEFHIPILCMNYTDVAEGSKWNQVKALQRIADFLLGVDRQPTEKDLKVDTVSTAPERQKDQIKNYAEVVKTLKGIKYQQLLH
ncbi:hypothetical protein B484DRAFT_395504 [Ochromonadaceae sp. CCMP2298]|nr:hypothetical protein B484DRAFT_395504 [Ochromonadaceae sp. CCMP2298]